MSAQVERQAEISYTPDRIADWLELGERLHDRASVRLPVTAADGGQVGGAATYTDVLADLKRSARELPDGSLERLVILERIRWPRSLHDLSIALHRRHGALLAAHRAGCVEMARTLGWRDGATS